MAFRTLTILVAAIGCACAAPSDVAESKAAEDPNAVDQQKEELITAASSSYNRGYSDWGGYPSASSGGYGVTGYGTLDSKYNNYNSYYGGYGGNGGYGGYAGNPGYSGYAGNPGYSGYAGNSGFNGYAGSPGYNGYAGSPGYGGYDYNGYSRYGGGYGLSSAAGNGGYGGYGGNGGLLSYYGYNSPYNQGSQHLGLGYYNKRQGNIYNSGVTPSLVTGYRGYSRR